jgi:GntR family transcriptional regulator / MocR family aminotransferase
LIENNQTSLAVRTQSNGRTSRSRALYDEIRARIGDGTFAPGMALPSTRAMAAERCLSRATVTLVYEQLAADGFIETRSGASSRVASVAIAAGPAVSPRPSRAPKDVVGQPAGRLSAIGQRIAAFGPRDVRPTVPGEIDFIYGPLSGADFPTLAWSKAMRQAERQRIQRLEYDDPRGNLLLRKALHAHLSQTRGLVCSLDQILIVNGSQQALDLCARLLLDPGDRVVVENPGYLAAHQAFMAYGASLACIDVDEHGLRTDQLAALGPAQMAFVTPTHQFPLGSFLSLARRRDLLAWAKETGAWVIEDDYDSEYRFSVGPEETLQSLDRSERVIHVGTFSKTLSPQLRLGYMVLPPSLVDAFVTAKRLSDRHAASGVQRALARLLEDGTYARHVRRIRRVQLARQRALTHALTLYLGDRVAIQGAASGLHVVVWCLSLPSTAEGALAEAARKLGVRVHPISPLFHPGSLQPGRQGPAGLVMGYALLDEAQILEGVKRLSVALGQTQAGLAPGQAMGS